MTTVKIPKKAVVLLIGCTCSGKSTMAKKIVAETPAANPASFSYDETLKEYLLSSGLLYEYSVAVTDKLGFLSANKLPSGKLDLLMASMNARVFDLAWQNDFVVIDSEYASIEQVKMMLQAFDSVRGDKHLALLKLAPDSALHEHFKKMRINKFKKPAELEGTDFMATMPLKSDYQHFIPVVNFNYGTPPPDEVFGIPDRESLHDGICLCIIFLHAE